MSIEDRLMETFATYRTAARPSPELLERIKEGRPSLTRRRRIRQRRTMTLAAAIVVLGAVLVGQQLWSRTNRHAPAPPTEAINNYVAAIRPAYVNFYHAAYSLGDVQLPCGRNSASWTPASKQPCRDEDVAAAAAALALHNALGKAQPPSSLRSVHEALVAASESTHDSLESQIAALDRNDRQGYLDDTRYVAAAVDGFCQPIHQLNHYLTTPLLIAGGC
jgi:hypothetical protein